MLRCTLRRPVVFTQGFPTLERFAQEHFLPSNPLSSSCLWLDEDDFRGASMHSKLFGVPNPLRIDPYAHHSVLSRFAQRVSAKKKASRLCAAAATTSATSPSPDATGADKEEIEELLRTSLGALRSTTSDDQRGGATSVRRNRRGRPPKTTTLYAEPVSADRVTAPDLSHYAVPICSIVVTKPLYLLNMDQMCFTGQLDVTWSSGGGAAEGQVGGDALADRAASSSALSPSLKLPVPHEDLSRVSFAGGDRETVTDLLLSASPFCFKLDDAPHHRWMQCGDAAAFLAGVRELQRRFPNPPGACMFSVQTRRQYGMQRQRDLRAIAAEHRYQSKWWGTKKQWAAVGAKALPGQLEHVVPVDFHTKLVHISLIENAAEVLERSYILPRQRRLMCRFERSQEAERGSAGIMEANVVARVSNAGTPRSAVPQSPSHKSLFFEKMSIAIKEDMKRMQYKLPLYFSMRQLTSLGLTVRPDAQGVDLQKSAEQPRGNDDDLDDSLPLNAALAPFHASTSLPTSSSSVSYEYWYHLSQVHFPPSFLLSSTVLVAEMDHPGVALHGVTGALLPHEELTYASLVDYHSDIAALLPRDPTSAGATPQPSSEERATQPDAALAGSSLSAADGGAGRSSLEQPHKAEDGAGGSGVVDTSAPTTELRDELDIARFVAAHASPKLVQGRHLWFTASDVLAANGIVDVNSPPVEVRVKRVKMNRIAASGSDDAADASISHDAKYVLYNVEALTDPDEALRKLSLPFTAL